MLTLDIEVPSDRNGLARARLLDGEQLILADRAAASADIALAEKRGNTGASPLRPWGHPPLGGYSLLGHSAASGRQQAEYGEHLFVFEPTQGSANSAIAYGRVGLLVYGGAPGADKRMRRTQGGVRLAAKLLAELKARTVRANCKLIIRVLEQPPWWKFWQRKFRVEPLSTTAVRPPAPPDDEMSLTAELLRRHARKPVYGNSSDDRRNDDERRDDRSFDDNRSSSSATDHVRGGGGQSGGAGASGGWDGGGRIPAGAAAGAAAALTTGAVVGVAAAAAATSGEFETGASDSSLSGTSTRY
jgi:uncharacterized membrane protein YgcG